MLVAQVAGNGVIQGIVSDPSGAVVPGATVRGTNEATGVTTTRTSTEAGFYVLSPLAPGEYTVSVSANGFQKYVQEHVTVDALSVVGLNLTLSVGSTTQEVTVTAAPPMLDTSNGALGATISGDAYEALPLPLSGGPKAPYGFIYLLPGVANGSGFAGNMNGGEAFSSEIYVNGIPLQTVDVQGDYRNLAGTSVEVIDQFQIITNGTPASYDGQGTENYVFKSGTNKLHGDAYEFVRNTALDSRNFFSSTVPVEIQNEFGGTVSGPIKKNRLFYFGNYDGYRESTGAEPMFYSLPTAAEREGDFSALPTTIYDPATTTCNSEGLCTRQAFAGNIIPEARFSSISSFLQSALPSTINSNLLNNYIGALSAKSYQNDFTIKVDMNISDKARLYGVTQYQKDGSSGLPYNGGPQLPLPYASSGVGVESTWLEQGNLAYTIRPSLVNVFAISLYKEVSGDLVDATASGDWATKAGLTGLPAGGDLANFPSTYFVGPNAPNNWHDYDYASTSFDNFWTVTGQDNLQWVHGKHSVSFGGQVTHMSEDNAAPANLSVVQNFTFSNAETAGINASGAIIPSMGNAYASYLLGGVDSAALIQNGIPENMARFANYAFYGQDDLKATPRLTINLGLRYDLPRPYVSALNAESFLNPSLANPAVDGYPGLLEFFGYGPDSCMCRSYVRTYHKDFAPRIGFAYQINKKTVLRGGFGTFYYFAGPFSGNAQSGGTGQLGYTASPYFGTLDGGITPAFNWNNGFPAFQHAPTYDPTLDTGYNTTTPSGGGITYGDPLLGGRLPYTQNWHLTVERELWPSTVLKVSYSASNSHFNPTGIGRGKWSDQINPVYMALGPLLTAPATSANISAAQAIFPGVQLPYANFAGTIGQMLTPFPQYAGVGDKWPDFGNSNYNSLQVTAQRRFSHGLQFLISYTLSKEIDDAGSNMGGFFGAVGRTAYNNKLEKAVGNQDIPNNLVMSWVYKVPFGAGHRLGSSNKVASALVSGWQWSGIQSYTQGTPLGSIGANCTVPHTGGCYADYNPNFSGSIKINGSYGTGNLLGATPPVYLNINAFQEPAPYTFGGTPRNLAYHLRNTTGLNENLSLSRDIKLKEFLTLRLVADAFNAFNRVQFTAPNIAINSSAFGQIGSQYNTPREFQFDGKLIF
jgi:hypothetical protein